MRYEHQKMSIFVTQFCGTRLSEHQNETSASKPHRANAIQGVIRLERSFNVKSYENVEFTSISENKEHEWSHDCLRIATNAMFTQMSANKGIKLFKNR